METVSGYRIYTLGLCVFTFSVLIFPGLCVSEQNGMEDAECELQHRCLQVRRPQHEQEVAVGVGHTDKECIPRHH
jgi:hypothetical protein